MLAAWQAGDPFLPPYVTLFAAYARVVAQPFLKSFRGKRAAAKSAAFAVLFGTPEEQVAAAPAVQRAWGKAALDFLISRRNAAVQAAERYRRS